jgi:hypothetical protein
MQPVLEAEYLPRQKTSPVGIASHPLSRLMPAALMIAEYAIAFS